MTKLKTTLFYLSPAYYNFKNVEYVLYFHLPFLCSQKKLDLAPKSNMYQIGRQACFFSMQLWKYLKKGINFIWKKDTSAF